LEKKGKGEREDTLFLHFWAGRGERISDTAGRGGKGRRHFRLAAMRLTQALRESKEKKKEMPSTFSKGGEEKETQRPLGEGEKGAKPFYRNGTGAKKRLGKGKRPRTLRGKRNQPTSRTQKKLFLLPRKRGEGQFRGRGGGHFISMTAMARSTHFHEEGRAKVHGLSMEERERGFGLKRGVEGESTLRREEASSSLLGRKRLRKRNDQLLLSKKKDDMH